MWSPVATFINLWRQKTKGVLPLVLKESPPQIPTGTIASVGVGGSVLTDSPQVLGQRPETSCHMRGGLTADVAQKKPSILTNSEIREGPHYVDEQNTHRASTCLRHLLTHVRQSLTHNCSLLRARSSHSCPENTRVKNASVLMHDTPRSLSGACFYIRALKCFFLPWLQAPLRCWWYLPQAPGIDGRLTSEGCLSCLLSQGISAITDSNLLLLTPN